jgi:outer membrane protein assembly factor BamB
VVTALLVCALFGIAAGFGRFTGEASQGQPGSAKVETTRAWPMFGGSVHRNMVNLVEKNIPTEWNVEKGQEKNLKWVAKVGSRCYGGPVVAGGKIFLGTNNESPRNPKITGDKGVVMCFRESDGQFLWQAVHDKLPSGQANDFPQEGVASTPAVDGNRVYYVSNRCEVVCLDTEGFLDGTNDGVTDEHHTGKTDADVIWRLDMMKEFGVFPRQLSASSPLVAGDLVYVLTGNGVDDDFQLPAPKAPSFLAIHKKTGKVVWQDNSPGDKVLDGQWSNPAYAVVNGKAQVIYGGGDGWLRAFEAETGKPIWQFDCNPKAAEWKKGGRGTRNLIISTPVVHENKVYVGVGQEPESGDGVGHLWCVDLTKTGDLSPVNDNFDPKAAVNKNSGLVWHRGGMADPKTAQETGRDFVFGRTMSTCAVHDGLLYIAEIAGFLLCLDAGTGQKYWDHDLKAAVWGSPYWVDGKVYIGNEDGDIYVFAHGKQKRLIGNRIEMGNPVLTTPVAVNGVLYIGTKNNLYAIANK